MIYANSVPIANAAQMGKDVVDDCLGAIFLACEDLIRQDRNISLQMGFCCMRFTNRSLTTIFASYLGKELGNKDFETQMRRTNSPVSTMWQTSASDIFRASKMGNLVSKPNRHVTEAMSQKTQALKLMSMDMSSAAIPKKPFQM